MAQKTNLNVSPYYDDFNSEKNYYKVLFNPGRPVQARELTTSQSILQNQIESFGSHMFKEGSMVIPGNIAYDGQFYSAKLNSTNFDEVSEKMRTENELHRTKQLNNWKNLLERFN